MANMDIETATENIFSNANVQSFSWTNVGASVKANSKKHSELHILQSCAGHVSAGSVTALMGPSGSGKTTLLNILAGRSQTPWTGDIQLNGLPASKKLMRDVSGYVEQDDALIGSLSVRETVDFAARLALKDVKTTERKLIVGSLIKSFGLAQSEYTIIGTPLKKGISGGQKRRVSVASQLVTSPKVLFLDEPTSGLDSVASFEVMKFVKSMAKKHNLIIICSIHQPSTTTFHLFDNLLLLSKGRTCYFGPLSQLSSFFEDLTPVPTHMNPAEFMLDLVNTDFVQEEDTARTLQLDYIWSHWETSSTCTHLQRRLSASSHSEKGDQAANLVCYGQASTSNSTLQLTAILLHRNFIKSYRDLLAYGTRIAMYSGLAILMGSVWLRLDYTQTSIQPFVNALFFGGAFMSFMAVAYVPSIIEDIQVLRKEHANGLYGPMSFMLANFMVGIPWLFIITILFSIITYFLSNFRLSADGFWLWCLWLFLDLLAAESLVVLLSSIFPIFVVSLAATAFANGLWMSVGGFLVPLGKLNVFYKYVFHYIDYQAYVFQAMMVNQFKKTVYSCDKQSKGGFYCMYPSDLQFQGKIRGTAILKAYNYSTEADKTWEWFGIMLAIISVYRALGYLALWVRLRQH